MFRYPLVLAALLTAGLPCGRTQSPAPKPASASQSAPPTTLLAAGAQIAAVPELLYHHLQLPNLKPGQGVVVRHVTPGSPAARAGLRRYDVLLSFAGTPIRDGAHLVRLVGAALPDAKTPVLLVRSGQEMTVQVALNGLTATEPGVEASVPKGMIRPDGPPAVSVAAEPLAGGKLRVTFLFYSDGTGKLERVTCSGSMTEIQSQVRTLGRSNRIPTGVQALVDVALDRIRSLNSP